MFTHLLDHESKFKEIFKCDDFYEDVKANIQTDNYADNVTFLLIIISDLLQVNIFNYSVIQN